MENPKQTTNPSAGATRKLTVLAWWLVTTLISANVAVGQSHPPGPPPPPPGPGSPGPPRLDRDAVAEHMERVRARIAELSASTGDNTVLVTEAHQCLERAEEALHQNKIFVTDRLVAASDAFVDAEEHERGLPDGPRGPGPVPRAPDIAEHLQHVYFHLQQADYFAQTSGAGEQLPELARGFYERALQAYDESDWRAADSFAKATDDTIRGLENLAQAATPLPPRPK